MSPPLRFKPWMRWTAFAVVLVGAAVIAWHIVDAKTRRELEVAKAAFAAHGFPTRLEDILPPPVPEEENADAPLREAWRIVTGATDWERTTLTGVFSEIFELNFKTKPRASGPSLLQTETREKLVRLAADPEVTRFAAQIQFAIRRPVWRCGLDYAKGPALLTPHIAPARMMVRLLTSRAVALAQNSETVDAAWTDLHAAQTIADWVDDETTLITYLTGIACHSIIREATIAGLQSGGPPSQLEQIIGQHVQSIGVSPAKFERAVHAERLGMFAWIEHYLTTRRNWLHDLVGMGDMPPWVRLCDPWLTPVLSPLARPRLAMELRECLELHLEVAVAVHQGGPAMVLRLEAVRDKVKISPSILPQVIFPSLESIGARHLAQLTQRRALVVVLSAWRHRQHSGAWPTTIGELALSPDLTTDACSGQTLVLRVDADAIIVYGPGFDRDDDGGKDVDIRDLVAGDGDIVVRVHLQPDRTE